jgi:hypothetical protein
MMHCGMCDNDRAAVRIKFDQAGRDRWFGALLMTDSSSLAGALVRFPHSRQSTLADIPITTNDEGCTCTRKRQNKHRTQRAASHAARWWPSEQARVITGLSHTYFSHRAMMRGV